eukprot:m.185078 g.185078  ORF g.185078 m.185078 type:complete len:187 (-) comp10515_c0_seq5:78-638(-)
MRLPDRLTPPPPSLVRMHACRRIIWPTHGIIVVCLVAATAYTIVVTRTYEYACSSPGWMALASMGALLGLAFLGLVIFLELKISNELLTVQTRITRKRFRNLAIICSAAALIQFAYHMIISSGSTCDSMFKNHRNAFLVISVAVRIFDTIFPIWAVAVSIPRNMKPHLGVNDESRRPLVSSGMHDA